MWLGSGHQSLLPYLLVLVQEKAGSLRTEKPSTKEELRRDLCLTFSFRSCVSYWPQVKSADVEWSRCSQCLRLWGKDGWMSLPAERIFANNRKWDKEIMVRISEGWWVSQWLQQRVGENLRPNLEVQCGPHPGSIKQLYRFQAVLFQLNCYTLCEVFPSLSNQNQSPFPVCSVTRIIHLFILQMFLDNIPHRKQWEGDWQVNPRERLLC